MVSTQGMALQRTFEPPHVDCLNEKMKLSRALTCYEYLVIVGLSTVPR